MAETQSQTLYIILVVKSDLLHPYGHFHFVPVEHFSACQQDLGLK